VVAILTNMGFEKRRPGKGKDRVREYRYERDPPAKK